MTMGMALQLVREGVLETLLVAGPILLIAMAVGLIVAILQATTSIQEQTLSFIPKILVTGAVLTLLGPWMLDQMLAYMTNLYTSIPSMVGP